MPSRPRLPTLLAAAFALVLAACGDDRSPSASDAAAKAMAVTAAPVSIRRLPRGTTVSGEVGAVEEMQLGVELNGLRVTALDVDVGHRVVRGQRLLALDHRTLDSDLAQAEAALREAEAGAGLARANLAEMQMGRQPRYAVPSRPVAPLRVFFRHFRRARKAGTPLDCQVPARTARGSAGGRDPCSDGGSAGARLPGAGPRHA